MTPRADESFEKYWTVGIDCGEQKHRFVMLDEYGERRDALWVVNRADEIQDAFGKLTVRLPLDVKLEVVSEGLRSIAGIMVQVAISLGIRIWQVNPKALDKYRELEGQPRKDDDQDAENLGLMRIKRMKGCRLAVDVTKEELVLCRLTRLHTRLVRQRTAVKAQLRSRLLELSPEVVDKGLWTGPVYDGKGMRAVLTKWPAFKGLEKVRISNIERLLRSTTRYGNRCAEMAKKLKVMAKRIMMDDIEREVVGIELSASISVWAVLDSELVTIDKKIEEEVLRHPVGRKLMEMPGVAAFTAGVDIGEVLPIARNMSEGKTATYAGLTPLSRVSGKKDGPSKLARGVNRWAASSNYQSAIAATKVSALDKAYLDKQKDRHRGHPVAHIKAAISLARQRFKVKYKLMTTDAHYDKEKLIKSHLERAKKV